MSICFVCGKCGKAFAVRDELAGRQGPCPTCGTMLTVPTVSMATTQATDTSPDHCPGCPSPSPTQPKATVRQVDDHVEAAGMQSEGDKSEGSMIYLMAGEENRQSAGVNSSGRDAASANSRKSNVVKRCPSCNAALDRGAVLCAECRDRRYLPGSITSNTPSLSLVMRRVMGVCVLMIFVIMGSIAVFVFTYVLPMVNAIGYAKESPHFPFFDRATPTSPSGTQLAHGSVFGERPRILDPVVPPRGEGLSDEFLWVKSQADTPLVHLWFQTTVPKTTSARRGQTVAGLVVTEQRPTRLTQELSYEDPLAKERANAAWVFFWWLLWRGVVTVVLLGLWCGFWIWLLLVTRLSAPFDSPPSVVSLRAGVSVMALGGFVILLSYLIIWSLRFPSPHGCPSYTLWVENVTASQFECYVGPSRDRLVLAPGNRASVVAFDDELRVDILEQDTKKVDQLLLRIPYGSVYPDLANAERGHFILNIRRANRYGVTYQVYTPNGIRY